MSDVELDRLLKIFDLAETAANAAGDEWMANAKPKYEVFQADIFGNRKNPNAPKEYMLDVCGNAYLTVKDLRTAQAKLLKKHGFIAPWGNGKTVETHCKYDGHQAMGLREACIRAFQKVLAEHGFPTVFHSYID